MKWTQVSVAGTLYWMLVDASGALVPSAQPVVVTSANPPPLPDESPQSGRGASGASAPTVSEDVSAGSTLPGTGASATTSSATLPPAGLTARAAQLQQQVDEAYAKLADPVVLGQIADLEARLAKPKPYVDESNPGDDVSQLSAAYQTLLNGQAEKRRVWTELANQLSDETKRIKDSADPATQLKLEAETKKLEAQTKLETLKAEKEAAFLDASGTPEEQAARHTKRDDLADQVAAAQAEYDDWKRQNERAFTEATQPGRIAADKATSQTAVDTAPGTADAANAGSRITTETAQSEIDARKAVNDATAKYAEAVARSGKDSAEARAAQDVLNAAIDAKYAEKDRATAASQATATLTGTNIANTRNQQIIDQERVGAKATALQQVKDAFARGDIDAGQAGTLYDETMRGATAFELRQKAAQNALDLQHQAMAAGMLTAPNQQYAVGSEPGGSMEQQMASLGVKGWHGTKLNPISMQDWAAMSGVPVDPNYGMPTTSYGPSGPQTRPSWTGVMGPNGKLLYPVGPPAQPQTAAPVQSAQPAASPVPVQQPAPPPTVPMARGGAYVMPRQRPSWVVALRR